MAAFLFPVHIFIQGVAIPLGWVSSELLHYERLVVFLHSPIVKIYLFLLIVPPLFHAAHRIRLTLEDLRIEWLDRVLPLLCYGGAILLTIMTLIVLL